MFIFQDLKPKLELQWPSFDSDEAAFWYELMFLKVKMGL